MVFILPCMVSDCIRPQIHLAQALCHHIVFKLNGNPHALAHLILFPSICSISVLTAILNWHFLFASKSKRTRPSCPSNESSSSTLISQQTRRREESGTKKTLEWRENQAREWRPVMNWKIEILRGKPEKKNNQEDRHGWRMKGMIVFLPFKTSELNTKAVIWSFVSSSICLSIHPS